MKIPINTGNSKNMFREKVIYFIIGGQIPQSMADRGKMLLYFSVKEPNKLNETKHIKND